LDSPLHVRVAVSFLERRAPPVAFQVNSACEGECPPSPPRSGSGAAVRASPIRPETRRSGAGSKARRRAHRSGEPLRRPGRAPRTREPAPDSSPVSNVVPEPPRAREWTRAGAVRRHGTGRAKTEPRGTTSALPPDMPAPTAGNTRPLALRSRRMRNAAERSRRPTEARWPERTLGPHVPKPRCNTAYAEHHGRVVPG
jgi:hypothetical protein